MRETEREREEWNCAFRVVHRGSGWGGRLGRGRAYCLPGHQSTATVRLREPETKEGMESTKGVRNEMVSKGKQK